MKPFNLLVMLMLSSGLLAAPVPQTQPSAPSPEVKLIQKDQVLDVEIGGQLFTTYHFADDFIRPFVRPFLWPVRASDGTDVTIDQAQVKDLHPHQRSIWIGHGDVNGADQWRVTKKPIQPGQRHVKFNFVNSDSFQEQLIWDDKDGNPMLNEVRTMRFIAYPDGCRAVDVTLQLSPVKDDVVFADDKDCGLFAIRLLPSIAGHPQLLNSTGGVGDDGCSLKPADWCDESGQIDGKTYGAAILDDPHNPRHPPLWHAHTDERLSPDIFSLHKFDKIRYPKGAGNFTIKAGESATFRYRAVIHAGDAVSAQIAAKYTDFVSDK